MMGAPLNVIDPDKAAVKINRLVEIAAQLRNGQHFQITRLTSLKALCADPAATTAFGLHLTKLTRAKAKKEFRPLIEHAVRLIQAHLRTPGSVSEEVLWAAFEELRDSQNEIRHHRWAEIRIIHSKEALLAECAMECVLRPWESVRTGYRLATLYAERYDPRYGTGLIPASASAVEDIAAFWAKHFHMRLPRRVGAKRTVKAKACGPGHRAPITSE
jgi:hypothetical protein